MRQGERVKASEGTRQKSVRKFAIWTTHARKGLGRSERIPSDCLSKTQVPAKLVRGCIGAEA